VSNACLSAAEAPLISRELGSFNLKSLDIFPSGSLSNQDSKTCTPLPFSLYNSAKALCISQPFF
jgi:hypothetical protein